VTFVNQHPNDVVITVNGRALELAPGDEEGPVVVTLAPDGGAGFEVRVAGSSCPPTKVPARLEPGMGYRLGVIAGPIGCGGFPEPGLSFLTPPFATRSR